MPDFSGRLVRGRYAGWWTFGVEEYEDGRPNGRGAIYAMLLSRPPDDAIPSFPPTGRDAVDVDALAERLVREYGGYAVYIPSAYPRPSAG